MPFSVVSVSKVKVIGMPIGGGVPVDGDGDGKFSLPGGEDVIPLPDVALDVEELWGAVNRARIESRRKRLAEAARKRKSLKPVAKIGEIDRLFNQRDLRGIKTQMKAMFEHGKLGDKGNVSSKVTKVSLADGPFNVIDVEGEFRDESGKVVGYFNRRVFTDHDPRRRMSPDPHVYLSLLNLRAKGGDATGAGIGRDFGLLTDEQFRRSGLAETKLMAGLRDGPFVWAKEGFDWTGFFERQDFLDALERSAAKIKEDKEVEKYFNTPKEYQEFIKLIKMAHAQDMDDKNRLTPYAFTLFSGAKDFFTTLKDSEGNAFSWSGKRKL